MKVYWSSVNYCPTGYVGISRYMDACKLLNLASEWYIDEYSKDAVQFAQDYDIQYTKINRETPQWLYFRSGR